MAAACARDPALQDRAPRRGWTNTCRHGRGWRPPARASITKNGLPSASASTTKPATSGCSHSTRLAPKETRGTGGPRYPSLVLAEREPPALGRHLLRLRRQRVGDEDGGQQLWFPGERAKD